MGAVGLAELDASFAEALGRLRAGCDTLSAEYETARPYPHLKIDGLLDPDVLDRIVAEFPRPDERDWHVWQSRHESKATSKGIAGLSSFTQMFFRLLVSNEWVEVLQRITGIDDLVPDPLFFGAGLQESGRGGWLDIHSDYAYHPVLGLSRRLNLLIYLNRDWDPAWGGDLELWDRATLRKGAAYAPSFNRLVLFPTTAETLHGHPIRLSCGPDRSRRLASVYYWSAQPPDAPADASALARLRARAHRLLRRSVRKVYWRGPKFYDVDPR